MVGVYRWASGLFGAESLPRYVTRHGVLVRQSTGDCGVRWLLVPEADADSVRRYRPVSEAVTLPVPYEVALRLPSEWRVPVVADRSRKALFARRSRVSAVAPETADVILIGWYADQVVLLANRCGDVWELAADVPVEHGRVDIQRTAEVAAIAGAGLLADARQVSHALESYLAVTDEPDAVTLDAAAQRLAALQAAWSALLGELDRVRESVAWFGGQTRSESAREALLRTLDVSARSGTDVDVEVAARLLADVRRGNEVIARTLGDLKAAGRVGWSGGAL